MAFVNQERKQKIHSYLKNVKKEYEQQGGKLRFTLSVENSMKLRLRITGCDIDLLSEHVRAMQENYDGAEERHIEAVENRRFTEINHYHMDRQFQKNTAFNLMLALRNALNAENWNNSRSEVDYFDVGYYIGMELGSYKRPFEVL